MLKPALHAIKMADSGEHGTRWQVAGYGTRKNQKGKSIPTIGCLRTSGLVDMSMKEILKHLEENDLEAIDTEEGIIGAYMKERLISIIIPTYRRKDMLLENLQHLEPIWKDVEIVIIDDCSPDGTEKAVKGFVKGKPINLKYVRNETNQGTVKSLNIGIREASNNFILMIADDNQILQPKNSIKILKESDKKFIATRLKMETAPGIISQLKGIIYKIPAQIFAGEPYNYNGMNKKNVKWCNNAFFFDRRIDVRFNEKDYVKNFFRSESEFEVEARKKGIDISYHPEIVIFDRYAQHGGLRVLDKAKLLRFCMYNHITFLRRNFRLSQYYKIPFYFMLKTLTHPHLTGQIIMTFDRSFKREGID